MQIEKANQLRLPEHLIALDAERWALWRCVGLRGAGFPVTGVLKLAVSECARIADDLIEAEDRAERAWEAAIQALSREIDSAATDQHSSLVRAMRLLKKGQTPQGLADGEARQNIEKFAAIYAEAEAISQVF